MTLIRIDEVKMMFIDLILMLFNLWIFRVKNNVKVKKRILTIFYCITQKTEYNLFLQMANKISCLNQVHLHIHYIRVFININLDKHHFIFIVIYWMMFIHCFWLIELKIIFVDNYFCLSIFVIVIVINYLFVFIMKKIIIMIIIIIINNNNNKIMKVVCNQNHLKFCMNAFSINVQ